MRTRPRPDGPKQDEVRAREARQGGGRAQASQLRQRPPSPSHKFPAFAASDCPCDSLTFASIVTCLHGTFLFKPGHLVPAQIGPDRCPDAQTLEGDAGDEGAPAATLIAWTRRKETWCGGRTRVATAEDSDLGEQRSTCLHHASALKRRWWLPRCAVRAPAPRGRTRGATSDGSQKRAGGLQGQPPLRGWTIAVTLSSPCCPRRAPSHTSLQTVPRRLGTARLCRLRPSSMRHQCRPRRSPPRRWRLEPGWCLWAAAAAAAGCSNRRRAWPWRCWPPRPPPLPGYAALTSASNEAPQLAPAGGLIQVTANGAIIFASLTVARKEAATESGGRAPRNSRQFHAAPRHLSVLAHGAHATLWDGLQSSIPGLSCTQSLSHTPS